MAHVTYKVVRHEDGWAYTVNGAFSESFPTHAEAPDAARHVSVKRLFVWFSDNRRVEVVRFVVALFVFRIIIIVGVSRGLRVTYDGDETPIDQPVGNVLRYAWGHVGLLRMPRMSCRIFAVVPVGWH